MCSRQQAESAEREMMNFAYGLVAVYFFMGFLFAAQYGNDMRILENNISPGHDFWKCANFFDYRFQFAIFRFNASSIDPDCLTEFGREYQKKAVRHHQIMTIYALGGFAVVVAVMSYAQGFWTFAGPSGH
jgi:hypothetical protein